MIKIIFLLLFSFTSLAGPTKVGNGDDGSDLEGFDLVHNGKLIDSKAKAVELLKKLNTQGIKHLGTLIPELENTKIYLTKRDISASKLEELGAFHSGVQKFVYARTFPRPYAATRFFPASLKLEDSQLIALHIHEALHRALPEAFREDEKVVTNITLAIVTPMSSHDQVEQIVKKNIDYYTGTFRVKNKNEAAKVSFISHAFHADNNTTFFSPLQSYTRMENRIYPFSDKWSALGLGLDVNHVVTYKEKFVASLGLFLSYDLITINGFDIQLYGLWNRDSGNGNSVVTSYMGRDSFRSGIVFEKSTDEFFGKNKVEFLFQKNFKKGYAEGEVDHEFGSRTYISSELLKKFGHFRFGTILNVQLFGRSVHQYSTNTFSQGRSTIISLTPKMSYVKDQFELFFQTNLPIADNRQNDKLNLHDLESEGISQKSISAGFNYTFN